MTNLRRTLVEKLSEINVAKYRRKIPRYFSKTMLALKRYQNYRKTSTNSPGGLYCKTGQKKCVLLSGRLIWMRVSLLW